ncbi:uncharacterized protein LOC129912447 isoform X3 [Episyrphus balteatus]|uniref:uncharacterized protein LOC129912447 isoform X3 n=1 Tax=Episyrphus balteatus TaxID=286459 RepID=UPI002485A59A|nr:uncharacterized protein LOC129912447 isoform X3 [Episyrphus balteatus]
MFGELFSYLSVKIRRVTMSLPGVGDNEQPTILEVLNRGIVDTKEETATATGTGTAIIGTESTTNNIEEKKEDVSNLSSTIKVKDLENPQEINNTDSDILVIRNSSSGSNSKWNEPPQRRSQLNEDEEDYVYDIESHLIETLKNYSVSEDSETWGVDIKELPPVEGESLHRTSKIETDSLIGTVIEVEPASPKVLKPVEISVVEPQRQSVLIEEESQNSSELKVNNANESTNSEDAQILRQTQRPEELTAQNFTNEDSSRDLQIEFESAIFNNSEIDQQFEYSIEASPVLITDLDSEDTIEEISVLNQNHTEDFTDSSSSKVDINQNLDLTDQNNTHKTDQTQLNSEQKIEDPKEDISGSTKNNIEPTAPDPIVELDSSTSESSSSEVTTQTFIKNVKTEDTASLTQEIDQKLSELSTHLPASSSKIDLNGNISSKAEEQKSTPKEEPEDKGFDINGLPLPRTAAEEVQRREFLDSLPQVSEETDSNKVAALAKREYYQSLRQYLITHVDRPQKPPETYRWEDLKRAKQRGGYPWTHLHKRPLGPDEEPEIVLLLRKSQELRFTSESPKSFKKVRIDDQVSIKETERYIQELSDNEENSQTEDEEDDDVEEEEEHEDARSECISCVSDSVLTVEKKASKLGKLRGILKKRSPRKEVDSRSLPDTSTNPSTSYSSNKKLNNKSAEDVRERQSRGLTKEEHHHKAKCFPIMKKLKSMADKQKKNFRNIKKISLKKDEKIPLDEEQKIIKLKTSPKAVHSEIPHFIEKQDSDDVLEIIELDESPSRKRKDQLELQEQASAESTVLVPDEIIDIPTTIEDEFSERQQTPEPTVSEILEEELKSSPVFSGPPKKAARLRREHVYEDIEDTGDSVNEEINTILQMASVEALKQSLANQDNSTLNDVEATKTALPLERMGSSEEEIERASRLAPLSSIDSVSSQEEEKKPCLSPVAEESDAGSVDGAVAVVEKEVEKKLETVPEVKERVTDHLPWTDIELKPVLKKEASPAPSEKKVTFSHVEDEAEPHREDIELPEELRAAAPKRWSNLSDHEYEPIGEPTSTEIQKEPTPEPTAQVSILKKESSPAPVMVQEMPKSEEPSVEIISDETPTKSDELKEAEELQKDLEDRYFNSAATTSQPSESQNDYEMQTSQMDSSALEDIPMEAETKKKGFMANAQDRTRRMQAGLKNQAGKIKTKFRSQKKAPSGSPKATTRKRFKAPEFSKIKMPEMKRPEFTKFSKPDMSKFKLPDKFSSLKLNRSKSFKEPSELDDTTVSGTTPESGAATAPPKKQRFDFSFGTYPRAFRKKSKPEVVESTVDEPSVIQSTETQPSAESSSTPQGDRGPGPVRSRWADKFSDVSYNDSEGSRYRRFESEQESSFDRESSMERRMKEVLEDNAKEEAELAMFSVVEQKQFADYDEENRVIHEISKTRERDFKRRPMVHQDSDLVSEEGRDIGWTQREAEKNEFLRKAELEAESHSKNLPERDYHQDAQSTASSKRLVFEEISSDEFLLRKKGASQEFSIGSKQKYVDTNLEAGFEKPVNPLELIGSQSASLNGSSIDRIDYGYDVPPPKPRRLSQQQRQRYRYDSENASQIEDYADDISLSQAGSDYFRHAPPARPLRKGRFRNSQDMSIGGTPSIQYDDEDYSMRDRNFVDEEKENIQEQRNESPMPPAPPPQPPRRRRKQLRDSLEKDSYVNGFGGRSVSNSYLREDNKPEEVIVYRTEHEYKIPLATPENYTDTSVTPRKSKSLSRLGIDEDDRTSRGADSLALDIAMREENDNLNAEELHEKYIIEMMENDGYAVVRKENLPKPTPPARRKKFTRSPGERFATMPHQRKAASPSSLVGEQKISSTGNYSTIGARPIPPTRRSASSLAAPDSQKDYGSQDFTDYEEPELDERPESPRNLQSGDIINKMKYRPLPPPPRPPREKRHFHRDRHGVDDDNDEIESRDDRDDRDGGGERIAYHELHEQSSEDYSPHENVEVEVSTQTDPLPDDFVCEEFEITEDMKIIEPRRTKTLDEILKEEEEAELERAKQIDEEILARGIQRFREASQRSASDRSRASSQAKSLSRPQTPSAILIEKRIPTPVPNANGQTVIEASLTVQPIDDLDLEEELLRKEGLYDGSHSKSDEESRYKEEEKQSSRAASEEENARIDEEVQSYTRSTDAESQQQEETDRESELERERELERELELERERELEHERELEQEREELMFEAERRMQEEEAKREREQEEEANRRLQEEVEADERLLRELEEEQRFLEEALLRHAEKEKELERRIREEEEEEREKRRIAEEQEIEQRLHPDSQSEEHESYDEDQHERLKAEDSSELKSDVSEEKETTPLPSPSATLTPHQLEEEVLVSQVKKLLLEQPPKDESYEREKTLSPPPMAPPRKRSTANEALSVAEQQPMPVPFTGVMPSHLAIADLEVERLRVHALQAGQIMVSHLHGAQIQAEELECRSGNLVVKNIELPPGFIEDIVERVRSTEREHAQASTQTIAEARTQTEEDSIPPPPLPTREPETPPVRPPPPSAAHFLQLRDHDDGSRSVHLTDYHLQTIPPIGFYNHLHTGGDDEEPAAAAPPPVYRRRRHLRRRDSSSEEEHQRRRSRSIRPEQPPQSVAQAGRQFISACSLPLVNIITQLTNALRPNNNDNNKDQVQPRNISTAVVVLIVMALSLVIYLLTGRNIHHHHWDYFNPPGNDGRLS